MRATVGILEIAGMFRLGGPNPATLAKLVHTAATPPTASAYTVHQAHINHSAARQYATCVPLGQVSNQGMQEGRTGERLSGAQRRRTAPIAGSRCCHAERLRDSGALCSHFCCSDKSVGKTQPCPACSKGEQSDPTKPGFCGPCPAGTAAPNAGTAKCTACPINTTALTTGSAVCTQW